MELSSELVRLEKDLKENGETREKLEAAFGRIA